MAQGGWSLVLFPVYFVEVNRYPTEIQNIFLASVLGHLWVALKVLWQICEKLEKVKLFVIMQNFLTMENHVDQLSTEILYG